MPTMSGNLTALRSSHTARVYMSLLTGSSVLTGTVSADADETSELNIAYTLDTGDAADVLPGYRVMVYDSSGYFKGMTSVRYSGTISSTNIPVRELSAGEILVVSGDTFTVYDDVVLTDKLPAASVGFEPDSTTYTDQGSNPPPIATSGGNWAGWLTSAGTVAVPFDGSDSYTVDPDSSGTITHAWSCASGTWDDATSATPTLTLSAAGKYTVFHQITDDTNSKTDTQVIRVRVHDANDPPYECLLSNNSGDPQGGFGVTMTLFANADLVTIPDLAPVLVWQDQTLAGTPASYGAKVESRSHVVLNGFVRRDRGRGSGDTGLEEIEFEVINPLARLGELPGFSKVMLRNQSPADWQNIKTLTVWRAIVHLLRNYTNITQHFDLVSDGFPDAAYPAFYVQKQTTLEQARELADSRGGRIVCDRTGRIEVQLRIEFTALASRTSLDTTISLSSLDIINYELSRDHAGTVETYRARGFTAATDTASAAPLFARWPASPARGNAAPVIDKLICDDQSDLFNQCALRGAWENAVFYEAGGIHHRAPEVRLTLFGGYAHLFQFYRELVFVQLLTNMRGITTLTYRFIPQSVSVDYADGTATTTLVMRAETHASGSYAVDDTPAAESYAPTDPGITFPPILTTSPILDADGLSALTDTLAVFDATNKKVHIVTGFRSVLSGGTPSATGYALSLTGSLASFTYIAGSSVNGVVATTEEVRSISDIFGARTLGTAQAYTATNQAQVQLQSERGNPNNVVVMIYRDTGGSAAYYSTDAGATWTASTGLTAFYDTNYTNNTPNWANGIYADPRGNGKWLTSCHTSTASPPGSAFYRSTDSGATFALYNPSGYTIDDYNARCIVRPLNRPDDVVFFGSLTSSNARLIRVIGSTRTDISPSTGGKTYGVTYTAAQRAFSVADGDPNAGVLIGIDTTTAGGYRGVFQTFDALATTPTWNVIVTPALATGIDWRGAYYVDRTTIYLFGTGGTLAIAKYVGGAWGLYSTTISGCGEIVGICGGG